MSRNVPRGAAPRKFPLIRILLLVGLGVFLYTRVDDLRPRLREVLDLPAKWREARAREDARPADAPASQWSADSSRFALECRQGLAGACCETLEAVSRGLCGEAGALLRRAGWKGVIAHGAETSASSLRIEARREPGDARLALSGLAGRDAGGAFRFRRSGSEGDGPWCEAARGCLRGSTASPAPPLAQGRLELSGDIASGEAVWVSASPRVRAVLPGRVVSTDSAAAGTVVRVYHGFELYVSYGPLRVAPGVRSGAAVKTGSHLGDALPRGTSHAVAIRVRKAGRDLDPAAFWAVRAARTAGEDALYSRLDP